MVKLAKVYKVRVQLCQTCCIPVLSSKELSDILSCFRDHVRKKLDLYSSSRGATYCNICSKALMSAGWFMYLHS